MVWELHTLRYTEQQTPMIGKILACIYTNVDQHRTGPRRMVRAATIASPHRSYSIVSSNM